MYKIFDAHTHVYPEKIAEKAVDNLSNFYDYDVKCKGTFDDLEMRCKNNGAEGFLLLTVATNAHQVPKINDYAAQCLKKAKEDGFTSAAFAGIHQDMPDDEKEAELDRCLKMGITGVKIHPDIQMVEIDDKTLYPLYEMLISRNMPITFHMGDVRPKNYYSKPEKLVKILKDFPSLRVIAAHLGGYSVWDEALETFAGRRDIMFDSSSSLLGLSPERAMEQINRLGKENIMFGTDYPSIDICDELDRFMKLGICEEDLENILWNNAVKFLGL